MDWWEDGRMYVWMDVLMNEWHRGQEARMDPDVIVQDQNGLTG